ncbi:HAD family phosphatase [Acidobacterium sp. S8]|uniref:HAD family hydrolase n=1 Tax=Acidobacterium sp. S8 TaxID=1641854 RepID=UPI00131C7E0D|nr:HAD family phosphatase [Acidobacterium sp. S8]
MTTITTILWDVGGVLLTNGWDHKERAAVLSRFGVDHDAFEQRHPEANDSWEKGLLTIEEYLEKTVFYNPRSFSAGDFIEAMKEESKLLDDSALGIVGSLAPSDSLVLGMLNNEARELNDYRIAQFKLRDYFKIFLSSCYVGLRKPDECIFELALDVLQCDAQEIAFVDDRAGNVEAANAVGMRGIQYMGSEQLKGELERLGVSVR